MNLFKISKYNLKSILGELHTELIGGGQFTSTVFVEVRSHCLGSLVIHFKIGSVMTSKRLTSNINQNFFNRSHLGFGLDHIAVHVKSDGNCCWSVYEGAYRRGKPKILRIGEEWRPTFEPKSFLKVDC